jgi:ABC-2 type transport system permease protein
MLSQNTGRVFSYELRRNFRRKGYLFMTFGLPILVFVLFFGYQFFTNLNQTETTEEENIQQQIADAFDLGGIQQAGLVDPSGAFQQPSGDFADMLTIYPDEAAAQQALNAGDIDVYYIVQPDYLETGDVTAVFQTLSVGDIGSADTVIQRLVYEQIAGDTDPYLLLRLRFPAAIQEINPQREGSSLDEGSRSGLVLIFSLTFLAGIFITSGYLMQSVIDEKETRLIEILISSVRPTQLLAGKIFALGLIGMLQISVWLIALIILSRIAVGTALESLSALRIPVEALPVAFAYFILGYLFFASGFAAVGAISTSTRDGPSYSVVFALPAALPYYFQSLFVLSPDATVPVIMSIVPFTSPLAMMMRLAVSNVPAIEIIVSLALLALAVVGMMWLAGRLFRVNSLLAGQVPKPRDIINLIRG